MTDINNIYVQQVNNQITVQETVNTVTLASSGYQGPTGIQGAIGVQGIQGLIGSSVQGIQGTNGAQGVQGTTGATGFTGAQGTVGSTGATGATGAQGVQGTTGATGSTGAQGVQGVQGTQGLQGVQGTQGVQGVQGTQGVQGSQGTQGVQGTQGLQGTQGTQGVQGSQGTQGVQGTQGLQGTQGVQGPQGTQVTQGLQGLQGIQGLQGLQGLTGSQGTQGVQGIQGLQGISVQGTTGSSGVTTATAPITYNSGTQTVALNVGTGLTTSSNNLIVDTTIVPELNISNTFTTNNTFAASAAGVVPLTITIPNGSASNIASFSQSGTSYAFTVDQYGRPISLYGVTGGLSIPAGSRNSFGSNGSTLINSIFRGSTNQTADLIQYQNANGITVLSGVNAAGQIYAGPSASTTSGNGTFAITAATASSTTVATYTYGTTAAQLVAGQTVVISAVTPSYFNGTFIVSAVGGTTGAYTFTVYNAAATFTASGTATAFGSFKQSSTATFVSNSPGSSPLVVAGQSGQQANLQEWQNSAGTALARMDVSGNLIVPSIYMTGTIRNSGTNASLFQAFANTNNTLNSGYIKIASNSSNQLPLVVQQAALSTGTITAAVANGTTIVYTTSNASVVTIGQTITVTGVVSTGNPSATAGSGFNVIAATVTAGSQNTITVTVALTDTYTSGGTLAVVAGGVTPDMTQWWNSSGTVLSKIDSAGNFSKGDGDQIVLSSQIFG